MTIIEKLDRLAARDAKYYDLSVDHSSTLAEATRLYWLYTSGESSAETQRQIGDPATVFRLMKRFRLNMAAAVGYQTLAVNEGQPRDVKTAYERQASKHAALAAVYAFAARNEASEMTESSHRDEVFAFTNQQLDLLAAVVSSAQVLSTISSLRAAEARGFRRKRHTPPFVMIIGANWCPDTTRCSEIANAFRVPVQLMFAEYIKPEEDKGKRKYGVLQTNDHAQALFEDFYQQENPSTPVVRYPNGVTQQEPSTDAVIAQFILNALI